MYDWANRGVRELTEMAPRTSSRTEKGGVLADCASNSAGSAAHHLHYEQFRCHLLLHQERRLVSHSLLLALL